MANSKGSSKHNASDDVKEEINSIKRETEPKNDDDDSENDLPLSARKKGNSNSVNQVVFFNRINQVVTAPKCIKVEDSDDDKVPVSSKFPMKSTAGTSGNKTNIRVSSFF